MGLWQPAKVNPSYLCVLSKKVAIIPLNKDCEALVHFSECSVAHGKQPLKEVILNAPSHFSCSLHFPWSLGVHGVPA